MKINNGLGGTNSVQLVTPDDGTHEAAMAKTFQPPLCLEVVVG